MRIADSYLQAEAELLLRLPAAALAQIADRLQQARAGGHTIFVFGNGGSAATASHVVVDMIKGTLDPARPRVKVICLNDSIPTLTALANDVGYDAVFAEPLSSLAEPQDIALGISGSGNSANVLRAMIVAREKGLTTIGITGATGGKLKDLCDIALLVPSDNMQLIEDAHSVLLHALFVEMRDS
jgi:D-sedoheptulose 7-phosphate isomerase